METSCTRRAVVRATAAFALWPMAHAMAAGRDAAGGLRELLARRRMIRRFTSEPVSDAQVARIIGAARRAPSAGNTQPWAFVVVRDRRTRGLLGRAALGQTWLTQAPVAVVACADPSRSKARYTERGDQYAVVDTAFASLLLLLAVAAEGLGACFVGALDEGDVRAVVGLPAHVKPLAVIPIGHPAAPGRPTRLRPLEQVVHRERWGEPTDHGGD